MQGPWELVPFLKSGSATQGWIPVKRFPLQSQAARDGDKGQGQPGPRSPGSPMQIRKARPPLLAFRPLSSHFSL